MDSKRSISPFSKKRVDRFNILLDRAEDEYPNTGRGQSTSRRMVQAGIGDNHEPSTLVSPVKQSN